MNNLSSYFGLVDAKIRASDKDLPVQVQCLTFEINTANVHRQTTDKLMFKSVISTVR